MARVIFLTDFSEEYARHLLHGIARFAQTAGEAWSLYRLPLSIRDKYGIEEVVKWARRMKVDAIIGQFYNTDNVDLFRQNGILAVAQDFKKRFTSIPNITGPHRLAGKMCAEYFINKGFRNFAFYGTRHIDWSDERCQGFRETIVRANPAFTFSALRSNAQVNLWYYDPKRIADWIRSLPKPVAIMACDDNQAYHIIEACQQIEGGGCRIPDDVAVLGVDNDETICRLSSPNLSSLNQGVEQGGYDVARLIDRMLRDPDAAPEDVVVMPTHIVTRQSTDIYANNDPHIACVLKYIHEHIGQKLTVNDLVEQVPLSRRLLETRFKREMGTSLYDYIIQMRIERMTLLLCNGLSVSEAAAELGFADIKNLSRTFKHIKGMTPSEYRTRYAQVKH
ncbi:DNA-binding transcriptional regulator [uncultured Alistipes sp.]|uniref:AraC family transcriptional regulator n=3 Tax=uncultured Alistipes sp. TaxID=538949 RepID=UPI0026146CC2|nr:DNA-binding transcriptional regulator [uncultured Alistipes sp.]